MDKETRFTLWLVGAVFLSIAVFCVVLATSYAPGELKKSPPSTEPASEKAATDTSPTSVDSVPVDPTREPAEVDVAPVEPVADNTVEPASIAPACCKECGGFGMDRPNCLAADCHCGDGCPCDETARCCPECLCDLKATPEPPKNPERSKNPTRPPAEPVSGPAWFYCLVCRQYSEYTAAATLRSSKCRHCGQWGAYRTLKPPEKPATSYDTPADLYYQRDSPRGRFWRPFGGFGGGGFGFGDSSNGQACIGTT